MEDPYVRIKLTYAWISSFRLQRYCSVALSDCRCCSSSRFLVALSDCRRCSASRFPGDSPMDYNDHIDKSDEDHSYDVENDEYDDEELYDLAVVGYFSTQGILGLKSQ
ncbi:hypothetical protein ACJW30_05G168800 [Castanea mollissima]